MSQTHSVGDVAPVLVVVKPLPQLAQDEPPRKYPTSQMHSEAEVAPGAAVVPLPQLTQDETPRKYPTSQMHSVTDVDPMPAVAPICSHRAVAGFTTQPIGF